MGVSRKLRLIRKSSGPPGETVELVLTDAVRSSVGLAEGNSDPLIITNSDGQVLYISARAQEQLGIDSGEISYLGFDGTINADMGEAKTGRRSRKSRSRLHFERTGEQVLDVPVEISSVDVENRRLNVIRLDLPADRVPTRQISQMTKERYRSIIQDQTELVCRWKPDSTLTFVNEAYCRHFGKSADELLGRSFMSMIPETEHQKVLEHFDSFTVDAPVQTHQHQVLGADGELHWQQWTNRAIFDDAGGIIEFQSVGSNISKLKQTEKELNYRLEFERIIMSLSSRFISVEPEEISANINHVLKTVGEFTGADRCYVFVRSADGKTMSNTQEWCAAGIEPHIGQLQNLPIRTFAYSIGQMSRGEVFHVPQVSALPDDAAAERQEFEREGIQSLICVPMLRRGGFTGFVGFDSVRRQKSWSADEIALLKVVGDLLTTALEREATDRALRENEQRYRLFVQNFQGIAYQSNMSWVPIFFHGAVEAITGYTEEEFKAGKPSWDQVIHPEDWDRIRDSADRIGRVPDTSVEREYRIITKRGEIRWVHEHTQNICDESGRPHLVQGALYDVTEQKVAAQKLAESEQRFRTMADFTYDWEYWLGIDGKCVYVSPSFESTTGYKVSEFERDFGILRTMTHHDDLSILDRHLNEETQRGKVTSVDFRIITRSGEERWINHVCQPVYDYDGQYLGRRASNRDITDRKLAEEATRRERDRAQQYLDVAATMLLALDGDEKIVLINRKGCEILCVDEEEVIGKNWFKSFVPEKHRQEARKAFRNLLEGGTEKTRYRESPVVTRNGPERIIAWYDTVVSGNGGEVTQTLSSGSDITERKHMERVQAALFGISEATNLSGSLEELLHTIKEMLGTLIDTTNFYVALYDAEADRYTFPYLVDQYHDTAELAPEDLKKTLTDYVRRTGLPLLADEKRDKELRDMGEVGVIGEPSKVWLGVPLETSKGVIGVVAVQSYSDATLYKSSDMDLMTFVSRHISMAIERKLAEEAIRESEEHYRSLVETMNEGLIVRDDSDTITFVNQRFCEMLGYSTGQLIGSKPSDYLDDQNWRVASEHLKNRKSGECEQYELEWTRKDGTNITTLMSPQPIRDLSGGVCGSFAVVTDITDRKRAEDKLRQATNLLRTEREALTQKNIALKEILDHIEKERQDYKQVICKDVEQTLAPFLRRLRLQADERRARELDGVEAKLQAVLARDIDVFRDRYSRLTPRELEICELIKLNMSSKEISERLNLSLLTVHKHREQIRRKLGITSKGINLSSYLQSH